MHCLHRSLRAAFAAICLTSLAVAVYAADAVELKYKPVQGQSETKLLDAELTAVELSGMPLGVTGSASAKLKTTVNSVDPEDRTVNLTATFSEVHADFNGQQQKPTQIEPMTLTLTESGDIAKLEGEEGAVDLFGTGGVPLQAIGGLTVIVRLPDHPVTVGDEWTADVEQEIAGIGKVTITVESQLVAMKGSVATIKSSMKADLPPFQAPNPIQPEMKVDVRDAQIEVQDLVREYDTKASCLNRADGRFTIDANVDVGGFAAPLRMTADFHLVDAQFAKLSKPGAVPAQDDGRATDARDNNPG